MSERALLPCSPTLLFQEPPRSVIFTPFFLSHIKCFMASSMDTGRFSLICSSPAISQSLAYVSLLIFYGLLGVVVGFPSCESEFGYLLRATFALVCFRDRCKLLS